MFFSDLVEGSKVKEIKSRIQELTNISHESIQIRYGFPPKVLTADDESTLKNSGITSGGINLQFNIEKNQFLDLFWKGN